MHSWHLTELYIQAIYQKFNSLWLQNAVRHAYKRVKDMDDEGESFDLNTGFMDRRNNHVVDLIIRETLSMEEEEGWSPAQIRGRMKLQ